jgi:uncharacterized protein
MEYKRFGSKVVVRLDGGDEIVSSITEVCKKENISSGCILGIGATEEVRTQVYDRVSDSYVFKDLTGSMEITSLIGNVTTTEEGLFTHIHITVADKEMNIRGGHLMSCIISPTGEIYLDILDGTVSRYPGVGYAFGPLKL